MSSEQHSLHGRAVVLRPLSAEDTEALFEAALQVGESGRYTRIPHTRTETERYVQEALSEQQRRRCAAYVIVREPGDQAVLGTTRFANLEYWPETTSPAPLRAPNALEIGWTWLRASAQRTIVNTEAKFLLLRYAFEVWQVERVTFKTDVRNLRSRAAIERIGASFEGILRRHMPAVDGGSRDTAMYSIIAPEWPACSARLAAKVSAAPSEASPSAVE
jgi:RimJ/RimL family protein N-acetyltransferase